MQLDSSVAAIVTGGASGLGEQTARSLRAKGVKVAILDMNAERGEAIAKETGAIFCSANVTEDASVEAALAKARASNGQERILVNCAGTGIARRTVDKEGKPHPTADFNKIIQINLVGSFRCAAYSAAGMAKTAPLSADGMRGVIVNTASIAAFDGQIGQAAYSASKGGIVAMTLTIARDLAQQGIRICTICPGTFGTPLMLGAPDNVVKALEAQIPFPSRMGKPPEFAALVQHICENDYLNGEVIRLDAAMRMPPR